MKFPADAAHRHKGHPLWHNAGYKVAAFVVLGAAILASCVSAKPTLAPPTATKTRTSTVAAATYTAKPSATNTVEPATATPPATNTPEVPTATPFPIVYLRGLLFLDANGSGLQDYASFVCPNMALATPPSLEHFFPGVCAPGDAGKLVTVMEPGLEGMVVSANGTTATTDANGNYTMTLSGVSNGAKVHITVVDPNANDPNLEIAALAMRYINDSSGLVAIVKGATVQSGAENETGLMIGPISNWYSSTLDFKPITFTYTDLNLKPGQMLDWMGNTFSHKFGDQRIWNQVTFGVYDQHQGTDTAMPIGTEILAMAPGKVLNSEGGTTAQPYARYVREIVDIPGDSNVYLLTYAHNSENLVSVGDTVQRGEPIALSGNNAGTETTNPHMHLSVWQVPRNIWNQYKDAPELGDFLFGRGIFENNGRAVKYSNGTTVALDYCPFQHSMFTIGNILVYP